MSNQEHVVLFLTSVLMGEHQKKHSTGPCTLLLGGGKKKKRDQKRDRERNIKILTYILLVLTVAWFFIPGRDSHRRAILINKSNIELVDLESSQLRFTFLAASEPD